MSEYRIREVCGNPRFAAMRALCLRVMMLILIAATSLILFPVLAMAADVAAKPRPLPLEPLEAYDNPPAPRFLRGMVTSAGMVSAYGPFTSYQVNVDASGMNITGDAANEPSISVDPTDHNNMVIGWRQFNSVASNFRQAGWGYTTDGGTTWTFPGVLENNVFRSDPVLAYDDTGRVFYLSLLQTFFDDMWRSLDGGQSWTNIAPADGGDKQWFTIDNTGSSGHGFQYQAWSTAGNNYGGRQFTRSTDDGVTWMAPINIPNSPQWGTLDVDENGNLFIGGVNVSTNQVWCIRSSNAKNGAVTPTFDQSTAVNLGGTFNFSGAINPAGLAGQLFLAVDRSGTGTNGNVYMLASVQPTGFNNGTDVMFVRSTDGGQSFSAPKRVNDDPINHNKWHWFGTLAVAPNGRIDSVWLDTRGAANNTDSQLFYSYSTDAGNTWSPNAAVSNAFNPFLGYPNQNKMGDYITMVSDDTGADVAYAATFNLEEDIYYVRVAPGVAPIPTPTASATPPVAPSPTRTSTPSRTPTPTATAPAPSPTRSSTPSRTPTRTPTPTATPTACSGGTTYVERSLKSGCVPAAGNKGNQLTSTTAGGATLSRSIAANTTEVSFAFTGSSSNLADWGSGTYTVELNVTTAKSSVTGYQAQLVRVNSSCGVVTTLATSSSQSGTGLKTFTFPSVASSGAPTDRLQVRILGSAGSGSGGNRTLTIKVNTTDSEVHVPWCGP